MIRSIDIAQVSKDEISTLKQSMAPIEKYHLKSTSIIAGQESSISMLVTSIINQYKPSPN
jgi:hypothetical protein